MGAVYTTVFKLVHPSPPDTFIMAVFNSVGEEEVHPILASNTQVEEVIRSLGLG